jgi:hypothetical protein
MNPGNGIKINCQVNDLMKDIRNTRDPIRRTILQKFLDIKTKEMKTGTLTSVLVANSTRTRVPVANSTQTRVPVANSTRTRVPVANSTRTRVPVAKGTGDPTMDSSSEYPENKTNQKCDDKLNTKKHELNKILKQQEASLSEFDKLTKINAYAELILDNKKENDQKDIEKSRGRIEKVWNSQTLYDPRYAKYVKEDTMNNKLMERLNSEIDFRLTDGNKMVIEKPFDDHDVLDDSTNPYGLVQTQDNKKYDPGASRRGGSKIMIRKNDHGQYKKSGERKSFY